MTTRREMMTRVRQDERDRVIRASEVGAYSYCAHAWWLGSVKGMPPEDIHRLQSGWAAHERHGQRLILSTALARLSYLLLILAAIAGLGWLVSTLVS